MQQTTRCCDDAESRYEISLPEGHLPKQANLNYSHVRIASNHLELLIETFSTDNKAPLEALT